MKRILLVDDSDYFRDSIKQILEREGYSVDAVPDGHEAVVKFRRYNYKVVVTDLYMPNMDGIALLNALKEIKPDIKFICMSGGNPSFRKADLNLARQMGADYVIDKPFNKMDLINMVWKMLN